MTIRMKLDPKEIRKAAQALREYATKLEDSTEEIQSKLCRVAAAEAAKHFDEDVTVTPAGDRVIAEGESVVFQEFGAGARVFNPYPDGGDVGIEVRQGAYSDLHYGEYAQNAYEFWHHDGKVYEYVEPRNGLFHGMMQALEDAPDIVREVLGDR